MNILIPLALMALLASPLAAQDGPWWPDAQLRQDLSELLSTPIGAALSPGNNPVALSPDEPAPAPACASWRNAWGDYFGYYPDPETGHYLPGCDPATGQWLPAYLAHVAGLGSYGYVTPPPPPAP